MSDPPHWSNQVNDADWLSLREAIDHVTTEEERSRLAELSRRDVELSDELSSLPKRRSWIDGGELHAPPDPTAKRIHKERENLNQEYRDINLAISERLRFRLERGDAVASKFNEDEEPIKSLKTAFWRSHIIFELSNSGWQIVEFDLSNQPDGGIILRNWKNPYPHRVKIAFKPTPATNSDLATSEPSAPANVASDQVKPDQPGKRGRGRGRPPNGPPTPEQQKQFDEMIRLLECNAARGPLPAAREVIKKTNPSIPKNQDKGQLPGVMALRNAFTHYYPDWEKFRPTS